MQELALREELLRRRDSDQRVRQAFLALVAEGNADAARLSDLDPLGRGIVFRLSWVDHDNTRWLRRVVARFGWPTPLLVGDDAAAAAWLLVQHADHDRAFQRHCLDLMRALPVGQVNPEHIALLSDRVPRPER